MEERLLTGGHAVATTRHANLLEHCIAIARGRHILEHVNDDFREQLERVRLDWDHVFAPTMYRQGMVRDFQSRT